MDTCFTTTIWLVAWDEWLPPERFDSSPSRNAIKCRLLVNKNKMKVRKTLKRLFWFLVVVCVAGGTMYYLSTKSTMVATNNSPTASTTTPISSKDTKEMDSIRNREDIKKQQELIVQETYLTEKKAQIQQAKENAIKTYDNELSEVESKLEGVRSEKLSFQ